MKFNFLKISLPIILLISVLFYITSQFIQPAPKKELIIASGSTNGNYHTMALEYKKLLATEGIKVQIINTAGSVENIKLLKNKKVDIAFIQKGVLPKDPNLEFLANIYYEPLWIFYKNEKYQMDYIVQLYSKTIAIGQDGSGTQHLAKIILNNNGINSTNSKLLNISTKSAKEKLQKGEIGAMFVVASHKSKIIQDLLEDPNVNVFNIKRANAYSRKYTYLDVLTLYEGTIDLYKNLPDENINLLSATATLVSIKNVPDELIRIFLKKTKEIHSKRTLFSSNNQFPNLLNTNLLINEEAKKYLTKGDSWLEGIFPYWIASNIDRLKILLIPLLTLLFPLFKGVFPLYNWSIRSKIFKWYKKINEIDINIDSYDTLQLKENLEKLKKIQEEVCLDIKVPLSYMGEYYNLQMHIELVISKIEKKSLVLI